MIEKRIVSGKNSPHTDPSAPRQILEYERAEFTDRAAQPGAGSGWALGAAGRWERLEYRPPKKTTENKHLARLQHM